MKNINSKLLLLFISSLFFANTTEAQISLPNGNMLFLNTSKDFLYDETRILFNTGAFKSDDYRFEKKMDSIDQRWFVTACFNGECWNELIQSGNFIKDFGLNDTTCFIAFHVETHGYDGKSVIKYNVYRKNNIADSANLEFNISFTNTSGIHAIRNQESTLLLYPNPASDKLFLEMNPAPLSKYKIQVTNVLGEIINDVYDINPVNGKWHGDIAVNCLSNGVYFIRINTDGKTIYHKFLVSH